MDMMMSIKMSRSTDRIEEPLDLRTDFALEVFLRDRTFLKKSDETLSIMKEAISFDE